MAGSYEQNEERHDKERADDKTSMALMRQDMRYMRGDLSEIKTEVRDLKQFYVTKEQATASRKDLETRIKSVEGKLSLVVRVGTVALLAFTGAVATAIAKLIFRV